MNERVLPHSVEAEKAVLGSIFIKPSVWPAVATVLIAESFFLPAHREIFIAMLELDRREMAIDPVAVAAELEARKAISRLEGGPGYLMDLAIGVPTAENVDHYVRIVRDNWSLRRVIAICSETASRAYGGLSTADEIVEAHTQAITKIAVSSAKEPTRIGDLIPAAMEEIERRAQLGPDKSFEGMRTGVKSLDDITWGLEAPDLVVIGADPGGGKTAFAMQAALISTMFDDWIGFVANLEMSKKQLTERTLARWSEINSYLLRRGDLKKQEWTDLYAAAQKVAKADLFIEDDITSMREYELRCRLWRARHPKKKAFGVFDYLQMAEASGDGRQQTRAQEVGGNARRLKKLAKELDMVQIAISSLNRDIKDVAEKPPTMKSLKESGDVEYAADTVILIWNKQGTEDGEIELLTAKNRKGPKRNVAAWWRGKHYSFRDLDEAPVTRQGTLVE
jgi:replicative DNA helicase